MAIVNLGNNALNINTTTAKGLEKVIGIIAKFVISAQTKTNLILFGKGVTNAKARGIEKALQLGVIKSIEEIASVDFCNLLNYVANIKGGVSFDPNGPPQGANQFEIKKWRVQNFAFQIQKKIDRYYGDLNSIPSTEGILELVTQINLSIESLLSPEIGLNDPEIIKNFPEISTATNYLSNIKSKFESYTNIGLIPIEDVQNTINFIEKVRFYCTVILSLNSPAALINVTNIISSGVIQESFNKVNQFVTPGPKVLIFLKDLLKSINNVNTTAKKILGYINLARNIIKLGLLLIKIFTIVRKFLFGIPIPAAFVPVGVTTVASDTAQNVVKEQGIDKPIKRLQQINLVLNLIAIFVTSLVAALNSIIISLNAIILNIKSCYPDQAKEIQDTVDDISNTRDELQDFLNQYNNRKNELNKTFGEYTIEIVTEELVDEGISLRRRYGIARNSRNQIVVESTPTFASLDLIIINEVKLLLASKGLVKIGIGEIDIKDAQIILDSLNYLDNPDITLQDIQLSSQDPSLQIDEESNSELTTFMNNLPGGKALRNRVRSKLIANNEKLIANLKSSDPNSTYSQNLIKEKENETNKLKIQKLEEEKSNLQKSLLLSAANPLGAAAIIAKIKAIDNEIKALKNGPK